MSGLLPVFKRELGGYFSTPVAYVFIVVFLVLAGILTFRVGEFFAVGQADLRPFFGFHPWLYLFLIPAISMRLWAEERKSGTIELLLTLPISPAAAVLGKFFAAWLFAGIALALTFPIWLTVNYLGEPDNGAIVGAYLGSLLMAGAFLAIGSTVSACTKSQVIAFVITVVVGFFFLLAGVREVLDLLGGFTPQPILEAVSSFSFLNQFEALGKGVVDARSIVFFASLIGCLLTANVVLVDSRRN